MKLEKIFIGGWFQRTTLQLSEIYDFVRDASSELALDKKKLLKLHEQLQLRDVEYGVDGLEYILLQTSIGIEIKIFEDGLIVLNNANITMKKNYLLH